MDVHEELAAFAANIAVPARAAMFLKLLDGRSYTAGELAMVANVTPQAASNHLAHFLERHFLRVHQQGRHRYYCFADERGARAVETLLSLQPGPRVAASERGSDPLARWRLARTCYDHLAGQVAVCLAAALEQKGLLVRSTREYEITPEGRSRFREVGVSNEALTKARRTLARQCLDWTERRPHIGGALGAALLQAFLERNWIRRGREPRLLQITPLGARELHQHFGLQLVNASGASRACSGSQRSWAVQPPM